MRSLASAASAHHRLRIILLDSWTALLVEEFGLWIISFRPLIGRMRRAGHSPTGAMTTFSWGLGPPDTR